MYILTRKKVKKMQIALILALLILVFVIVRQQNYISQMDDKVFTALKVTCETLDLIKKDSTIEEILELSKKSKNKEM